MSACTRTTYVSKSGAIPVDALTKQILTVANQLLALPKYGGEPEPMTGLQGSWRPKTSYSGTTHTAGGVVDVTAYNWRNRITVLDLLGSVGFHRTRAQGNWAPHIHTVTNGLACVAASAKGQIVECKAGGDGLIGNRPDPDKDLRSGLWPLAVYKGETGRRKTRVAASAFALPSIRSDKVRVVPTGGRVNVLMQVNVNGHYWSVTDQGDFMASGNLIR